MKKITVQEFEDAVRQVEAKVMNDLKAGREKDEWFEIFKSKLFAEYGYRCNVVMCNDDPLLMLEFLMKGKIEGLAASLLGAMQIGYHIGYVHAVTEFAGGEIKHD